MATSDRITIELRERLMRFINRRERAYKEIRKKGLPVTEYKRKLEAMTALRTQLQASESWSLRSTIMWICAMRQDILILLPYEFHDDPAQLTYRKKITDLLKWCEDQLPVQQIKLFNQTPNNYETSH